MDDKYTFLRIIEQTPSSSVYEVMCKSTKRHLSVRRFYAPSEVVPIEWENNFFDVMRQLARVQHVNVSPVVEADIDEDGAYMITDYSPTSKLHVKYRDGMSLEEFKNFVSHGLCALSALHEKGMIHGRLGYESFVLRHHRCGTESYQLKDYGIRCIAPLTKGMKPSVGLPANPVFISPEHFKCGYLNEQTDLYMFGQLCYVLLAGFHPIAGQPLEVAKNMHLKHAYPMISDYLEDIPQEIVNWIEHLTQPEAKYRPESAEAALMNFYQSSPKTVDRQQQSSSEFVTLAS